MLTLLLIAGLSHVAQAGRGKTKRIPNMPRGWAWPPTAQMNEVGAKCLTDLDALGVVYERAAPAKKINTPVVVPSLTLGDIELEPTYRKPPFVMDCHLARALTQESVKVRALGIQALRFSTIHNYRTIKRNGRKTRILSRHAIGLAADIFEVVLDDGTKLVVKKDYPKGNETLRALETIFAQSEAFRTPITPGNDPKGHDDHFHLEARMPL